MRVGAAVEFVKSYVVFSLSSNNVDATGKDFIEFDLGFFQNLC